MIVGHQRAPQLIQRGRASTLSLSIYSSGGTPVLTALGSSYNLYDPAGNAVVSAGAVTVSGNTASYSLGATELDAQDYGAGWREEWAVVVDGVTQTFIRPAALVRRLIYATLIPSDLSALHTELPQITEYTVTLSGVEVSVDWDTWAWIKLDNAWARILRELWLDDRLPANIEALSLDNLLEAIVMETIYRDLFTAPTDRFAASAEYWGRQVEALKSRAVLKYDLDSDGVVDTEVLGLGTRPRTLGGGWVGWQ